MTLFKELSLFPLIVCFKLKRFAGNRKLSFNKHTFRAAYTGGEAKGAPSVISKVYAGFHVICWLHFVREGGRGRKRGKREGKGS